MDSVHAALQCNHTWEHQQHVPSGLHSVLQVLLVLGIWFALWLARPGALSPHFRHFRLRLRGAATLLLRARCAWAAATAVTTLDSFASGFLLSTIYKLKAGSLP